MKTNAPSDGLVRCSWPGTTELYVGYHDLEWGVPVRDDRALYGKLVLDGFQAGLAWITILRKRDAFERAFDGFDPRIVAAYGDDDIARLLADAGIVRSGAKIRAAIGNARIWCDMVDEQGEGAFSEFLWSFVGGSPRVNRFERLAEIPAATAESEAMSKALRKLGWKFAGPTICYAFMQAVGMVNDHVVSCFRHAECQALSSD